MTCSRCPRSGALVCPQEHCGLCWPDDEELGNLGHPSEREMGDEIPLRRAGVLAAESTEGGQP